MKAARGLTLVEVLASLVLLSVLTAACVPLLQRAAHITTGDVSHDARIRFELATLAGAAINDPAHFGLPDWSTIDSTLIPWIDHLDRDPVAVARIPDSTGIEKNPDDPHRLNGHWLKFTCEGRSLFRWIAGDKSPESIESTKGRSL